MASLVFPSSGGRGRAKAPGSRGGATALQRADDAVRSTNTDALTAKSLAVKIGYYDDDALQFFAGDQARDPHHSPLILRGYYSRVLVVRRVVESFLLFGGDSLSPARQIVSLGAGSDTLFFFLKKHGLVHASVTYNEIDFPEITRGKVRTVTGSPQLHSQLSNVTADSAAGRLHSRDYNVLPVDLRSVQDLEKELKDAGFDSSIPTLFLSECVLIYMSQEESGAVLDWVAQHCPTSLFVTYEQIKPDDPFGKVMTRSLETSLKQRGCALKGLRAFPDEDAQRRRFLERGWQRVECVTMNDVYNKYLTQADRTRADKLQMMDEWEEWRLVQDHYCVTWAFRQPDPTSPWSAFRFMPQHPANPDPPVIANWSRNSVTDEAGGVL